MSADDVMPNHETDFRRLSRSVVLSLIVLLSCQSKNEQSKAESPIAPGLNQAAPAAPIDAAPAPLRFHRFAKMDYHWELGGFEIILVEAGGQATYVGPTVEMRREQGEEVGYPVWYRHDWTLSLEELEALETRLDETRPFELEDLYIDRGIEDGQNETYLFEYTRGDTVIAKRVQCSNKSPPAIEALEHFLAKNFLNPRREKLKEGTRMSDEEARAFWKPLTEGMP